MGWLLYVLLALAAFILLRNQLTSNWRRRLVWVSSEADKRIARRQEWRDLYDEFAGLSYERMMFDCRKWTYKSWYGDKEST